jgi:hypothetical protein
MKKIEISEGCFGPDVEIDGESLFIHEYDNRSPEIIKGLQDKLIDELKLLKDGLGMNHWYQIAEMVATISEKYEYNVDESSEGDSCSQCGNYNWNYVFNIKENEKES